jgi:hypothetical protein
MDDGDRVTTWIAATAIERDVGRIATEQPELWREVRRFNLPVKLALAAAHRVVGSLARPRQARLIGLAPCRPGSPELRAISRELDAGFARGSCDRLRVNPIYTLHAIDNLALSALAIRLENREACVCLGGAAGQAFAALEHAMDELAGTNAHVGRSRPDAVDDTALGADLDLRDAVDDPDAGGGLGLDGMADEVVIFGGDQSDASWRGERGERGDHADAEAVGVAIVLTARRQRVRLVGIERSPREWNRPDLARDTTDQAPRRDGDPPVPHAAAGLARWLEALAAAPAGVHRHAVPGRDGDGIDRITIVAEVA